MKNILLLSLISITLFSCSGSMEKILELKPLKNGEQFNEIPKSKSNIFNIVSFDRKRADVFQINFRDTLVTIKNNEGELVNIFSEPEFINSQKTAILVKVADSSGLSSPFYILSTNNGNLQAMALDRSFKGKRKMTGLEVLNRANFIVNNDFLIRTVNGKVYPIKRQTEDKPIEGRIFMVSKDESTLVFLTDNSFYQYNYITNESFNLPIDQSLAKDKVGIYKTVQRDYTWEKNKNGTPFLKERFDDNRIVDIKEFKH